MATPVVPPTVANATTSAVTRDLIMPPWFHMDMRRPRASSGPPAPEPEPSPTTAQEAIDPLQLDRQRVVGVNRPPADTREAPRTSPAISSGSAGGYAPDLNGAW